MSGCGNVGGLVSGGQTGSDTDSEYLTALGSSFVSIAGSFLDSFNDRESLKIQTLAAFRLKSPKTAMKSAIKTAYI
jgi:hypothetical protein